MSEYPLIGLLLSIIFSLTGGYAIIKLLTAGRQTVTPESIKAERERKEIERHKAALRRAIQQEARNLAREIPDHLAIQNKMVYHEERAGRSRRGRKAKKIRFKAALMTETEIWYLVDGRRLPYGTSFSDLLDPNNNVTTNLEYAIGREVRIHKDYRKNFYFRVGLHNSLLGVPKFVAWSEMVERLPKSRPFSVAVGVNENNKLIYQDLTKWPHGLVLGATGTGKSTCLRQWLITLISRNTPDQLHLYTIDLKRVELHEFQTCFHVKQHIDRPEQVQPLLKHLQNEMNRRLDTITGHAVDIDGWNRQFKNAQIPRIFLIVDELATITTDRNLKNAALSSLMDLARLGRAAGIHLILCTQNVSKSVLTMDITNNIEGRIVFSLNNKAASILALGTSKAAGMVHRGRLVFRHEGQDIFLQSPLATSEEVKEIILAASGEQIEVSEGFTVNDLWRVVRDNLGGSAAWRHIWECVSEYMGQKTIRAELKKHTYDPELENFIYLDNERYILTPPLTNQLGRHLITLNGHPAPKDDQDIALLLLEHGVQVPKKVQHRLGIYADFDGGQQNGEAKPGEKNKP